MNRMAIVVSVLGGAAVLAGAQQPALPDAAAIRAILAQRIDTERRNVGIVVGVFEPDGQRIVTHGTFGVGDARPVAADSIFEIGSITKVFTSLLLADMVERGEVKLDDPVAKYLPATVRMPERDGRAITLQDLSTHTSGLPRLPANHKPAKMDNPYADYTVSQLYEFLAGYTLPRASGAQYEYSNLGAGLLGHVLALRAGTDYESLLRVRILAPLAMTDTFVILGPAHRERLAAGHNQRREPVTNWDLPTLAGAGGLRSTVRDMLRFLSAFAGGDAGALTPAIARMRSVERPGPLPNVVTWLAWQVVKRPDGDLVTHGGTTGGYSSFIGFLPSRNTGVVVLSNMQMGATGVEDLGFHLLDARIPLSRPPAPRTRITLPAEALVGFVGRYQLTPGLIATVIQEGDRLFVQPTNQPRHEVFPEGPRSFFATIVDAQFIFEVDASGRATALTLVQGAAKVTGKRVPE